ncbi:MAG: hypothetical protein ACM3WS_08490 [Bacillota bacterium]
MKFTLPQRGGILPGAAVVKIARGGYTFLHCQKIFFFQALVKASIGSPTGCRQLG